MPTGIKNGENTHSIVKLCTSFRRPLLALLLSLLGFAWKFRLDLRRCLRDIGLINQYTSLDTRVGMSHTLELLLGDFWVASCSVQVITHTTCSSYTKVQTNIALALGHCV